MKSRGRRRFLRDDLKDICRENIDLRILVLPSIRRKAGLLTGVFQKSLAIPSIFCGDLREEKT
jgi:hypothetical protein